MSEFTRPANWLRNFFTPSRTGFVPPHSLSQDVSAVQPYDGSGWGMREGRLVVVTAIQSGVTGNVRLILLNENQILRLMGVQVAFLGDGAANTYLQPNIIDLGGTGNQHMLSDPLQFNVAGFNIGDILPFKPIISTVIGPSCELRVDWRSGGATVQFTVGFYGFLAPVGTVFYV